MIDTTQILVFIAISLAAAMNPGPNFFLVVKNSLVYSRTTGCMTVFGIALAVLIHLSYALFGIGNLMKENTNLFYIIKYSGITYLFYLGVNGVLISFKKKSLFQIENSTILFSKTKAVRQGFITNLLNPEVPIFFISLFSQL